MRFVSFAVVLASVIVFAGGALAAEKLSPPVRDFIGSSSPGAVKVWVYFEDHGETGPRGVESLIAQALRDGGAQSERARQRRLKKSAGPVVDVHDLPVHETYLAALATIGCRVNRVSKYLNAASAWATADEIRDIERLAFVRRVDRVQTARRPIPEAAKPDDLPEQSRSSAGPRSGAAPTLDYGDSYGQLDLMNVIPLHEATRFGQGVLVAMLDTGFNRRHEALVHLSVVAERDFINNDPVTRNQPGDPSNQHNHGTYTLSALAGYAPGNLIGPAWAASFALAKTERVDTEIQQEEDNYVAALEWADSLGADIVSSSLGYYDWYTYEDMDGNTAVTTIAADIAASRGIAVVTAAGNNGPLPWPGIIAPGDGDSVITVGAVDGAGLIAYFSSRGPTYDNRIKPDVCAQGVLVRCASPVDSLGYLLVGGTSLSTPLVAGASALCLQMHPYWSPVVLRDELRASASRAQNPDNDYGWGIIDAYQTALYGASGIIDARSLPRADIVLRQNVPNPFVTPGTARTAIGFTVGAGPSAAAGSGAERHVELAVYDVSGGLVRRLVDGARSPGDHTVGWDGLDDRGIAVASGVYYYRLSVGGSSAARKIVLVRR